MATEKVGIYRKYHGPIPTDTSGRPLLQSEWPKKRLHSWSVRWFGSDGKRYSKSFKTRKEAERYAEGKQSDVRKGKADPPPNISLQDFIAEHEKVMNGQVAPQTLYDQVRALRLFSQHVGKNMQLDRIRPRYAESFVASRLASGIKTASANKDIRTLKSIFNLAIEPRGYLLPDQNPFRKIKQRKQSLKPIRYVTPQEFQRAISAAPSIWWKALLAAAYTTAARIGEILNLTWSDLDFEHNRLRIVRKEDSKTLPGWEPKDHEGRVLPVPAEVMQLLADLQTDADEGCPYVFVPGRRWKHIQRLQKAGSWNVRQRLINNLNRNFAVLRKLAGVEQFAFHDLRRSCITNWAKHLPVHVVRKLAGHSDIKTTQQYYLSVQEDDLELARQVQSEILKADPTDPKLTHSGKDE